MSDARGKTRYVPPREFGRNANPISVILGLEPRIHATAAGGCVWMLGSRPSMTENGAVK
ncbi:UNVERIFIED_ORG: hypothetical protein GGI63_003146 [Rhizobium esperanzae]